MNIQTLVGKVTSYSKLAKLNILLLVTLMVASTLTFSFAQTQVPAPQAIPAANNECTARVSIVLDRSSSIGVDAFGGSANLVNQIKSAAGNQLVANLSGPDKYTDLFAFASSAERINGYNGWFPINSDDSKNLQKLVIANTRFKVGPTAQDSVPTNLFGGGQATPQYYSFGPGDVYDDGLAQGEEGGTNWEGALKLLAQTYANTEIPTHVVFFTDGNPTANEAEVNAVKASGGKWTGPNTWATTEPHDLNPAVAIADQMRAAGVKVIPVGYGGTNAQGESKLNQANLQLLAGAGNKVYYSENINELAAMFQEISENLCEVNPGIELTKTVNPTTAAPGDEVTYSFVVKNTGDVKLTNIRVTDPLLNATAPNVIHTIEELEPGQSSQTLTTTYKIPNDASDVIHNVATATGTPTLEDGSTQEDISDDDDADVTVNRPQAGIQIDKTADKTQAAPGETVTYTFVVTNTGQVAIDPTPVFDNVLGEIGDPGLLEPGESETLTKTYVVPADAQEDETIRNIATVCAPVPGTEDPELSDTDCETTCPQNVEEAVCDQDDHELDIISPEIQVEKTADKEQAGLGEAVTYTFVVTNTSDITLYDVEVTDNVLGDLGTIEKIEAGDSVTITATFTTPSTAPASGTIRNVVTACGAATDGGTANICDNDDHELIIVAGATTSVAPTTTTPVQVKGQQLAFTGSSSTWLATVGALILAIGLGLYTTARKRRNNFA